MKIFAALTDWLVTRSTIPTFPGDPPTHDVHGNRSTGLPDAGAHHDKHWEARFAAARIKMPGSWAGHKL